MELKSNKPVAYKVLILSIFIFLFYTAYGQQTSLNPMAYWVFTPYIYNPGIAGSKDFFSAGINAAFQGKSNSQLISGNTRISKTRSGYFSSPDILEFKNAGYGGSVFRDVNGLSTNIGMSIFGSYQIPLDTKQLSYLSFGANIKGVYNSLDNDSTGAAHSVKKTLSPDFDLGIYYYGTSFYMGVSSTNILGNPRKSDSLELSKIPVLRQYYFTTGVKILLNKSMNIVLEPSVLIMATDSTFSKLRDNINPIIKLYLEDFCFGTSYSSWKQISFFAQYRYPKFYIGAYYEIAKKTPYFKKTPIVEFTFGINIQPSKSELSNQTHW